MVEKPGSAPREAWVRDTREDGGKRPSQSAERRAWVAGVPCWVPDERRAFVEARVAEVKDGSATVSIEVDGDEPEQRQHHLSELLPRVVGMTCMSNMDELPELNKATVLQNVEMLFLPAAECCARCWADFHLQQRWPCAHSHESLR